jgi:hypothetical protein
MIRARIAPAKPKKAVPFSFVLEHLHPHEPIVKPMFGCYGIYLGRKLVLILRRKNTHSEVNGVWLATVREHHESLRKDFPSMQSVSVLGHGVTNWQLLHEDAPDFEEAVLRACALIRKGDPRIGTIPKQKRKKSRIM